MGSILVACSLPTDGDPVVDFAADLAARMGVATHLAVLEGAAPESILGRARETGAELLVLAPRIPPASSRIELDRAATGIVLGSEAAVLVVQPPVAEIRRILIPIRRTDLREGALAAALEWAERFRRAGEVGSVDVQLLHVARDPDELHADVRVLRSELDRLSPPAAGSPPLRRFHCVRWGAPPHERIARWVSRHGIDLVILRRHSPGVPPESRDSAWLHALGTAGCSVLALPFERPEERAPRESDPMSETGRPGPQPPPLGASSEGAVGP